MIFQTQYTQPTKLLLMYILHSIKPPRKLSKPPFPEHLLHLFLKMILYQIQQVRSTNFPPLVKGSIKAEQEFAENFWFGSHDLILWTHSIGKESCCNYSTFLVQNVVRRGSISLKQSRARMSGQSYVYIIQTLGGNLARYVWCHCSLAYSETEALTEPQMY